MLPEKLKKQIMEIRDLFNNYDYMKISKAKLIVLKNNIIERINDLEFYSNEVVVDLILTYKEHLQAEEDLLNVNSIEKINQFRQNCFIVKDRFKGFLIKVKKRINTFEIGTIDFSNSEKIQFYEQITTYIINNSIEQLENLLNENIIDLNYAPPFTHEDDVYKVPLIIIACQNNNLNIVKMLYNNNANINININTDFIEDTTPLLTAITNATYNIELIRYLLDNGASPDFANLLGETPLNEAINNEQLYKEMIIKYKADVNFNYGYSSVLDYACQKRNITCIKILLNNNANIEITDWNGNSVLHSLIRTTFERNIDDIKEVLDLFLARNFNIDFQNNEGNTILHQAAMQPTGYTVIKYLINKGSSIDITNIHGDTPLHCFINELVNTIFKPLSSWDVRNARYRNNTLLLRNAIENIKIIIDLFIIRDFNINFQNHLGNTVLHQSIIAGVDINIINHLLECGALINIENNDGKTAQHLAQEYGNTEIFNIVSNYQNDN